VPQIFQITSIFYWYFSFLSPLLHLSQKAYSYQKEEISNIDGETELSSYRSQKASDNRGVQKKENPDNCKDPVIFISEEARAQLNKR